MTRVLPRETRNSPHLVGAYMDQYVTRLARHINAGHCCLLIGPLGAGKTVVLRQLQQHINREQRGLATCVRLNAAEVRITPHDLFVHLLKGLNLHVDAGNALDPASQTSNQMRLHEWMNRRRRDVIILLDNVELLDRQTAAVYDVIRAIYMSQNSNVKASNGAAGRFIAVLASTEVIRHTSTWTASPLFNITKEVHMEDCPPAMRDAFWRQLLIDAQISEIDQSELVVELEALCAGDPYQMGKVATLIERGLHRPGQAAPRERIGRLLDALKAQPDRELPLLRTYAAKVENDIEALRTLLRISRHGSVPATEVPMHAIEHASCIWSGIFTRTGDTYRYRSELMRMYFEREFVEQPARVAQALSRKRQYKEAIHYLAEQRSANVDVDLLDSVRDVASAWVQSAGGAQEAWQHFTQAIRSWFGPDTLVLRYDAHQLSHRQRPYPYFAIDPESSTVTFDPAVAKRAYDAYAELKGSQLAVCEHVYGLWRDDARDACAIFPLIAHDAEFGSIFIDCHSPHLVGLVPAGGPPAAQDGIERICHFLDAIVRQVVEKERLDEPNRLLKLLADMQGLAQHMDNPAHVDYVLYLALTVLTAGYGLKFNRALLLQAAGRNVLYGRAGIGHFDQDEAHRAWRNPALDSETFASLLQRPYVTLAGMPDELRTPMFAVARATRIADWTVDFLLGDVLAQHDDHPVSYGALTGSVVQGLLRVEHLDEADGAANPVLLVPLWDRTSAAPNRRLGLLLLDKPFAGEGVLPQHLALLPKFTEQIELILRNEESLRERSLYQELSSLALTRLDLHQTIERVFDLVARYRDAALASAALTVWPTAPDRADIRMSRDFGPSLALQAITEWELRDPASEQPFGTMAFACEPSNDFTADDQERLGKLVERVAPVLAHAREFDLMREELESRITLEMYEMIEDEFSHQWSRRARDIDGNARQALAIVDNLPVIDHAVPEEIQELRQQINAIIRSNSEVIERARHGIRPQVLETRLDAWLRRVVQQWNSENSHLFGVECSADIEPLEHSDMIETRPVVLKWIVRELLQNAGKAERFVEPPAQRYIKVIAHYDPVRRRYLISIVNGAPIPVEVLRKLHQERPLGRSDRSGQGIQIVRREVKTLLCGDLILPQENETETAVTISIPSRIKL